MKRHHNFDNEITGEYYKEAKTELPWTLVSILVGIVIVAVIVLIFEWTGLADYLLGSLMN